MSEAVKLSDVAAAAGVHPGTASKALNPATRHLVSETTGRRVLESAKRLGYTANPVARGLRTRKSFIVGVVVPDLTNPLFPPMARGIEEVLLAEGYTALLANTDGDDERERDIFATMQARQVDGFIFATAHRDHSMLSEANERGVPLVLVNRQVDDTRVPSVRSDDRAGMRAAVRHLAELGHRRIAYLAGPQDTSTGWIRRQAFDLAMAEFALTNSPELFRIAASYSQDAGRAAARELIRTNAEFTALLAGNDLIALGAIRALAEVGRRCPDDVSVVGYNDLAFMDMISPPLTTISIPKHDLGVAAARLLLDRLRRPEDLPHSVVLPVELVVRASTGPRQTD
jgi:LacI family transcriptional regulator